MPRRPANTPDTDNERPRYAVPALEKGLSILEFLATDGGSHTQTEIARQLGRSQSEIFRMLTCLERRNYIRRGRADERYYLTSKLFRLAHAHPPTARLIDLAIPVMRRLTQAVEQSSHLVVKHEEQAVVIAQVDSPRFVSLLVRPGRTMELHESASGRVLAAFEPDDLRSAWLAETKANLSARRYRGLSANLRRIRADGYDMAQSIVVEGVTDLSVPVLDHNGSAAAVLSVPYVSEAQRSDAARESSIRTVLRQMRSAAREISRAIGRTQGDMED